MKRKCLILAVLGFILFSGGCKEQVLAEDTPKKASKPAKPVVKTIIKGSAEAEEAAGPAPEITFEKLVHDFGVIDPKSKNICEFKFTNTGKGMLKVEKKISSTCGCTVPTLKKENYAPGESGVIKVTFKANATPGAMAKRIHARTNDKKNPRVRLTIKAKVELQVRHSPKTLKLLLKKENANCQEITIYSVNKKPFSIKKFKSTGDSITADFDPLERKTKYVIQPKVDIQKLRKRLNGSLRITLDHPRCDTVSIPFKTLSEYKITPSSTLVIINAEPNTPVKREIWILNNYEEDFEIESLSSKNGIVKILEKKKDGNRYKLNLEIVPPSIEEKKRIFTDNIVIKIKDGDTLNITCRGFYKRKK